MGRGHHQIIALLALLLVAYLLFYR